MSSYHHHIILLFEFFITFVYSAIPIAGGIHEWTKFDWNHDRALTRVLEFIIADSQLNRCVIVHEHQRNHDNLDDILRELQMNTSVTVWNTNR